MTIMNEGFWNKLRRVFAKASETAAAPVKEPRKTSLPPHRNKPVSSRKEDIKKLSKSKRPYANVNLDDI